MDEKEVRVLDLFSGIGGFSLGLRRASPRFRTVAYCEIDPYCQKVLQARMRDGSLDTAPICTDVTKLDGGPWRGRVDLICGGFPCQDISLAGHGSGIDGERSGLWREINRLVRQIRPRFVFVENVSALLARGLDRVLGDLAQSGYDAEWDCIPASAVGAPHRRDRVWIVAYPKGKRLERREISRDEGAVFAGSREGRRTVSGSWSPEPNVGRVAHGVPARVDRLSALGNAVVPQVVEWIGRRIVEVA